MIINPYIFGIPYTPIFDNYGSSTVGFSMFKLRTAYTGNCLEVRRSSDNTTLNIGFVNNYLDTASLLAFVGSGNGFVRTWYDQSGNGNNLTQTTSASYQPQIVASGSLITRNGRATLKATSSQYFTITSQVANNTSHSWWISYEKSGTSTNAILLANGGSYMWLDYGASQNVGPGDNFTISPALSANTFMLMNTVYQYPSTAISYKFYKNGTQIGSGSRTDVAGAVQSSFITVPSSLYRTDTIYFNEFLHWKTDQTSNRSAIETDIKTRNLIY
jgi:hypothetical protein